MTNINLVKEARELMENTHSYDSPIAGKIDSFLKGLTEGKEYSKKFINTLLYDSQYLFEHTHSDETETYERINTYLDNL